MQIWLQNLSQKVVKPILFQYFYANKPHFFLLVDQCSALHDAK